MPAPTLHLPTVRPPPPLVSARRVRHLPAAGLRREGHRTRTVAALAARLTRFAGAAPAPGAPYWVPDATLLAAEAQALGITGEDDLFGGVVGEMAVAGKAITHPVEDEAPPCGWSAGFGPAVRGHTLPGASAFTPAGALAAGRRLLADGPVRVKPAWTDGGLGQVIVASGEALAAAIDQLDPARMACCGLVLERDLSEAVTFSVGRVRVGERALAYVGTQWVTRDNAGGAAYGGSRLMVVQGDFPRLATAGLSPVLRRMVDHAAAYDAAADAHLPGFVASRRNYDLVLGRDARGAVLSGVLEASWRIGGASGAEIMALDAFAREPALARVVASCHEGYGRTIHPPKEADVYYHADDAEVGPITKYAILETRTHA